MLKVEISASSRYPIRRKKIKEVIEKTLKSFGVKDDCLVEVNIVGDRKMKNLHESFLKEPGTTDVLSFPLQENLLGSKSQSQFSFPVSEDKRGKHGSLRHNKFDLDSVSSLSREQAKSGEEFLEFPDNLLRLGTIFVSYPQAQRQANSHYMSIDEEISQLVEHGMMHLLGIHHEGH